MGKQISSIRFIGTVGNLTGSKGIDGKILLREKVASVSNPQTVDQMNQRAKFKLAAKVAGMLGEVGQLALKANGYKATRRGTLNKKLMDMITLVGEQQAGLPRVLNLVDNPAIAPMTQEVTVTCTASNNSFIGAFSEQLPAGMLSAKALLVYDRTTEQWTKVSVLDASRSITVPVANAANCDAYFYAELVLPTTAEGAARLNNLITMNPGYTVAVNRLDASNYSYSRTFNAGVVNGVAYSDRIPVDENYAKSVTADTLYNAMEYAIRMGLANAAAEAGVSVKQEFANINDEYIAPNITDTDWEKLQVSQGNLTEVACGEANFATPLSVTVPIDDSYSDPRFNSDNDQVYLVIYDKTANEAIVSEPVTREDDHITTSVPGMWQGHHVEVYVFVLGVTGEVSEGKVSNTIYCGSGRIA